MVKPTLLLLAALAGCAAPHSAPATVGSAQAPAGVVLGTFDSRVLAIAYYRSEAFSRVQQAAMANYSSADDAERKRIEHEMEALQQLTHQQGFGTAPIPEILAMIEDEIPSMARAAGVQAVVCRWDLVWSDPEMQTVDLSLALAELFKPDDVTRKMLPEILKHEPVSRNELERHDH